MLIIRYAHNRMWSHVLWQQDVCSMSTDETNATPLVMPLWPDTGKALGLSRNATYDAARRGEIKTLRFGKLLKVPTAWLLETCGQKKPGDAA
jgi:hypothetical protein